MAESVIGQFKTELIYRLGPWKTVGQVEWETLKSVRWKNLERPHGDIECQTPNEMGQAIHQQQNELEKAAHVLNKMLSGKPGATHSRSTRP